MRFHEFGLQLSRQIAMEHLCLLEKHFSNVSKIVSQVYDILGQTGFQRLTTILYLALFSRTAFRK
jgi:hypothetical protein